MINYLILSISCLIAFISPVWGIGLLLVFETSIFNLGYHYATVPLPLGYAGPMDVMLVFILIGAIYQARLRGGSAYFLSQERKDLRIQAAHYRYSRGVLRSAILPYLLWLGICASLALMFGDLASGLKATVRSTISYIIPWILVMVVWLMRHRSRDILKIIIAVAVSTALVHLAIQLFDLRSLMMQAYYVVHDPDLPITIRHQRKIFEATVVRGLPQGHHLILYTLVFCFATFLVDHSRNNRWFLALFLLLLLALAITITRSLVTLSIAGCLSAIGLGMILGLVSSRVNVKIVVGVLATGILAMVLLASSYGQVWIERLSLFPQDKRIFCEKTVRGANNLAAIDAIKEQPFLGYGIAMYPEKFSRIDQEASDIYPLLGIGLFGGVVAIVLVIRLHFVLFWRFWLACKQERRLAARMLPYLSIFALSFLVNSVGAGGSLEGAKLIPIALYAGSMAAEMARSDAIGHKLKK